MANSRANSSSKSPLFIPGTRVMELVGMGDVIRAVEVGLGAFSRGPDGGVVQPVRSVVPVQDHGGLVAIVSRGALEKSYIPISQFLRSDASLLPRGEQSCSQVGHFLHE